MIDLHHHHHDHRKYEPPALVRIGAVAEIAQELEKYGASLKPSAAYQPGDPVDWSGGRVS